MNVFIHRTLKKEEGFLELNIPDIFTGQYSPAYDIRELKRTGILRHTHVYVSLH